VNELTIHTRTSPAGPVLELGGELDNESASRVRDIIPELGVRPGQQLLVDLGGLTFCDSGGITLLITARNHALAARADIVLAAVPERIARVFRIVGLDQVFSTYPSVQEAARAWARL
jgi:anti-anti-sigma factor